MHGRLWTMGALVICTACAEPTAPPTIRDAEQQVDAVVVDVNWAMQDGWKVGGLDRLVWVQVDTAVAPKVFRVERSGAVTDARAMAAARASFDRALPRLQRALDLLWRLGGRDVIVSVQEAPPHYLRYPARGAQ